MAGVEETSPESASEFTPLDELQLKVCSKNGIETFVSGIHIGFMEVRYYVSFKMPPLLNSNQSDDSLSAEEEEWLEYMAFLEEDLHWLLKLPHHRFWSQIVHDENLHHCLESYLAQAPRDYDFIDGKIKKILHSSLKKVHRLIFLVYLRMSTYKESKKHHIKPKAFGEIIYDNFIFDIPKLMDLCALYGFQNSCLLNKMIQNIFSAQPKYRDDLNETSKTILQAFSCIEEKLLDIPNRHSDRNKSNENCFDNTQLPAYHDVINYVADVGVTLYAFLENYPPACQIFHQNGAVLRIPTFYEQVFLILEKEALKDIENEKNSKIFEDIRRKITLSKTLFVKVFRNILDFTYLQNILNFNVSEVDEKLSAHYVAESFFEVIVELIPNKNFLSNYNLLYPFDADLEFFNELGIHLDSEKMNYLFCTIHDVDSDFKESFTSSVSNGARPKVRNQTDTRHKPVQNLLGLVDTLREKEFPQEDGSIYSTEDKITPSDVEISSLIQSVQDILPTYGEGFIEICLEYFEYSSEKVINAILSETLPDTLNTLDKNLKRQQKRDTEIYSILSERRNVFDNDEFDMFSRNVNMENVHLGKKNKVPSTYENLQKDEDSEFLKQLTLNYVDDAESESQINIYEDEYDDTYDSAMVGLKEPLLEDEPDDDDKDTEENKVQSNPNAPRPLDFCVNPEIAREKAEQRRQQNYRGRGSRGGSRPDSAHGRQQKDRHKAQVGNHNRQRQANFKKSRGMIPF